MDWPDSICFDRQAYVCGIATKSCQMIPEDVEDGLQSLKTRWSGYWINSLICPWITAKEIISNYENRTRSIFYTKVLGLPLYRRRQTRFQNLTSQRTLSMSRLMLLMRGYNRSRYRHNALVHPGTP